MKNLSCYLIFFLIVAANLQAAPFRILNGYPAEDNKWPWMVSISEYGTEPADTHRCGGTLIAPSFVLTAAHCVLETKDTPSKVQILLGRTRLRDVGGQIVGVRAITIHPNYSEQSTDFDIALIRLKSAVGFQPLRPLTGSEDRAFSTGSILGWGMIDSEYPIRPNNLQEATIPIIDDAQCEQRMGLDFIPQDMICGGKLASDIDSLDGIDTCFGDSGSPLMVQTSDGWKIAGIASWGFYCGSNRVWGVYTRVSAFEQWIKEIIQRPTLLRAPKIRFQRGSLICQNGKWLGDKIKSRKILWQDKNLNVIGHGPRFNSKKHKSVRCVETVQTSSGKSKAASQYSS